MKNNLIKSVVSIVIVGSVLACDSTVSKIEYFEDFRLAPIGTGPDMIRYTTDRDLDLRSFEYPEGGSWKSESAVIEDRILKVSESPIGEHILVYSIEKGGEVYLDSSVHTIKKRIDLKNALSSGEQFVIHELLHQTDKELQNELNKAFELGYSMKQINSSSVCYNDSKGRTLTKVTFEKASRKE